jgi:hypothetical protein
MSYYETFIKAIIENSVSDNYHVAIKEWVYRGEQYDIEPGEPDGRCACGHVIRDVRIVRNKENERTLEIGNCCIKKFGVKRKHFNGSKMAYLELGLELADSPGSRDYLKHETLPRIKAGKKFTIQDIDVLERITGKKSRFVADEENWTMHVQRKVNRRDRKLKKQYP